jgi:transposase
MNRDQFLAHYHKRSNVEATFSAIKRVFGDSVRSKSDTARVNEVLLKILCHNIRCLIHEARELGVTRYSIAH